MYGFFIFSSCCAARVDTAAACSRWKRLRNASRFCAGRVQRPRAHRVGRRARRLGVRGECAFGARPLAGGVRRHQPNRGIYANASLGIGYGRAKRRRGGNAPRKGKRRAEQSDPPPVVVAAFPDERTRKLLYGGPASCRATPVVRARRFPVAFPSEITSRTAAGAFKGTIAPPPPLPLEEELKVTRLAMTDPTWF